MLGFQLELNDETIQAVLEQGVTTVILHRIAFENRDEIELRFTGFDAREHVNYTWLTKKLSNNDTISIRVSDISSNSEPIIKQQNDPEDVVLQGKLKAYHELKKELEEKGLI